MERVNGTNQGEMLFQSITAM